MIALARKEHLIYMRGKPSNTQSCHWPTCQQLCIKTLQLQSTKLVILQRSYSWYSRTPNYYISKYRQYCMEFCNGVVFSILGRFHLLYAFKLMFRLCTSQYPHTRPGNGLLQYWVSSIELTLTLIKHNQPVVTLEPKVQISFKTICHQLFP